MNVKVTLNAGLGANLGPNFTVSDELGSYSQEFTKTELLNGIIAWGVDDGSTLMYVQSIGECVSSISLPISQDICTETTTTTTTTTTTLTPAPIPTVTLLNVANNILLSECQGLPTTPVSESTLLSPNMIITHYFNGSGYTIDDLEYIRITEISLHSEIDLIYAGIDLSVGILNVDNAFNWQHGQINKVLNSVICPFGSSTFKFVCKFTVSPYETNECTSINTFQCFNCDECNT